MANTLPTRRKRRRFGILAMLIAVGLVSLLATNSLHASASSSEPVTSMHYSANGNFSGSTFLPGPYGFNLADVESSADLNNMPSGVKALVWLGLCNGVDSTFLSSIQPYVGKSNVYGYYLMDEPDPTGQWSTQCTATNLKAESDWIHTNDPGKKTFIIVMNMSSSSNPSYTNTYKPSNSDIDLYGLDPYPCRSELNGCDYSLITKGVTAAESWGIPQADIVPVYEAFGGGTWVDDGGGSYQLPTASEESLILSTWGSVVPTPAFDYAYSWGSQRSDTALGTSSALLQVFLAHNTASTTSQSGSSTSNSSGSSTSNSNNNTSAGDLPHSSSSPAPTAASPSSTASTGQSNKTNTSSSPDAALPATTPGSQSVSGVTQPGKVVVKHSTVTIIIFAVASLGVVAGIWWLVRVRILHRRFF